MIGASDGRVVHAINQPMPSGGWVSKFDEDVTEQRQLQKQRDDMAEEDAAAPSMP